MKCVLNDNRGRPSYSLTMAVVAFVITCFAILIGIVEQVNIGNTVIHLRMIDGGVIAAFLTPVLGLYGFRRFDEDREEVVDNENKRKRRK